MSQDETSFQFSLVPHYCPSIDQLDEMSLVSLFRDLSASKVIMLVIGITNMKRFNAVAGSLDFILITGSKFYSN